MLTQLNPPIPFLTSTGQKVTALLVLDYGPDYNTLFLCGYDDDRQLWWLPNKELRMIYNTSLDRPPTQGA